METAREKRIKERLKKAYWKWLNRWIKASTPEYMEAIDKIFNEECGGLAE